MNAYSPVRQPLFLIPWPVLVLAGLLATLYAAYSLAPPELQNEYLFRYAFIPAAFAKGSPVHGLALVWPFFTYQFLHGSLQHLLINGVWLLPFGAVAARRFGASLFFVFFLICGALGAAFHLALNQGSPVAVIGASGAISGLMAAAFRMMGPSVVQGRIAGNLAPVLSSRILIWTAAWMGLNIVAGLTGLGAGPQAGLIAWQAHLGGYFAGLLLAGPFARLADLNRG